MQSLKHLYRIGIGPSSSHTMGPVYAAEKFLKLYPNASSYKAVLYGSIALTGKGHGTDRAIRRVFGDRELDIEWDYKTQTVHPNTIDLIAYEGIDVVGYIQVYSVGGGEILIAGSQPEPKYDIYPHSSFSAIKQYCIDNNMRLWQYVEQVEGSGVYTQMREIWQAMKNSIEVGMVTEGTLPGGLEVVRRASKLANARENENEQQRENRTVSAYAFAVAEQNASGGAVVTAPTCGASGVLPAVFKYCQEQYNWDDETIMHGLMTAGLVGNLIKTNASISGAECGCQAEIGSACCMTACGLSEMLGMSLDEIECSGEIALEHYLGLTCDPINGLVQIPCIERNAVAAMRSINATSIATFLSDSCKITLDTVIRTMYETGKDLMSSYKETAIGGLAKHYRG